MEVPVGLQLVAKQNEQQLCMVNHFQVNSVWPIDLQNKMYFEAKMLLIYCCSFYIHKA